MFSLILISPNIKIFDRISGITDFTNEISQIIKKKDLVISDRIIFSNIAYEIRDKSNNLFMPHRKNTPITNHFQIKSALNLDRDSDFYLIGELSDIAYLSEKYQGKLIKEFDVSFSSTKLRLYEISFK